MIASENKKLPPLTRQVLPRGPLELMTACTVDSDLLDKLAGMLSNNELVADKFNVCVLFHLVL